jgi:signal transduction histidine kinase
MSMSATLAKLNELVDWFIPKRIGADREMRKQARMFLYSHIFGPFIGNTVPLALYLFNPTPGYDIAVLTVLINSFWLYPFVLRATGRYYLLSVISIENLTVCILLNCYFYGGISSPTLPWLLTIPLLAFFYVGHSAKMRTVVLTQLAINLGVFSLLYSMGAPAASGMSATATGALGLVSTVAAALYVSMMALFYANALQSQVELEAEMREHEITAAALRQATDDAQRAGAAKTDFLAKMSHELRTPLNAVIGYSEILLEDAVDEDDQDCVADLKKIHSAGHNLLKLVNEVLDLSKIDAGKMEVFNEYADCAGILRNAAQPYLQPAREAGIELVIDAPAALGTIHTDVMKINQTLGELLDNAVKHTQKGKVTLKGVRIVGERGDEFLISVADTGAGIAAERFPNLFEQFNAAADVSATKYGGTNLGLSLSKKLCRLLQGDISVESELGVGSCFTIRLPAEPRGGDLADEPAQEAVDAALAAAEAHSRGLSNLAPARPLEKAVVNA